MSLSLVKNSWYDFPKVLANLVSEYNIKSVLEIGAGPNPSISKEIVSLYDLDYYLNDQVPHSWNAFAEVVWKDKRTPKFIGDIPHTWVGSDFINAIRSMFVYENEYDSSLVIGAALYQDWIDFPNGISVENLPTYYGEVSYAINKEENKYRFSIYGDIELPRGGFKIKNFNGSKLPTRVVLNDKEIKNFSEKEIRVNEFPVDVDIYYSK